MAVTKVQAGRVLAALDLVHTTFYTWTQSQYGLFGISHEVQSSSLGMDCGDYAWGMQTLFQPLFQPLIANPVLLLGARVVVLSPTNTNVAGVAASDSVGSGGANQVVLQQSGLISFRTAERGPKGRGRAYIPFPATQALTAVTGQPTAGYLSDLQDLASEMALQQNVTDSTVALTATIKPAVWHRFTVSWDIITTGVAQPGWATQRRRGDFGRPNPASIPL